MRFSASHGAAVLTLAVGLAYNTTAASTLDALLIRPYPFPSLGDLLLVRDATPREGAHEGSPIATGDFLTLQRDVPAFALLAAFRGRPLVVTGNSGDPERIDGMAVSAAFFDLLGVRALAGRTFAPGEDTEGLDSGTAIRRAPTRGCRSSFRRPIAPSGRCSRWASSAGWRLAHRKQPRVSS